MGRERCDTISSGNHEWDEEFGRSGKVVDVVPLPADEAHGVVKYQHKQGHAHGGIEVGRGRVKAGHQTDEVHGQDVDKHAHEQAYIFAAVFAHGVDDEFLKTVDQGLKKVLQPAGHQGQATAHDPGQGKQYGHTDPGIEDVLEFHHLPAEGDVVQTHKRGEQYRMRQTTCHEPCLLCLGAVRRLLCGPRAVPQKNCLPPF